MVAMARSEAGRRGWAGGGPMGGAMMGAVTSKDLASEVSSSFYVRRFDEDHGSSFVVEMLKVLS